MPNPTALLPAWTSIHSPEPIWLSPAAVALYSLLSSPLSIHKSPAATDVGIVPLELATTVFICLSFATLFKDKSDFVSAASLIVAEPLPNFTNPDLVIKKI